MKERKTKIIKTLGFVVLVAAVAFIIWFLYIRKENPGKDPAESETETVTPQEDRINVLNVSYKELSALIQKQETIYLPEEDCVAFAPDLYIDYNLRGKTLVAYHISSTVQPQCIVYADTEYNGSESGSYEIMTYKDVEIEVRGDYSMNLNGVHYSVYSQDREKALRITKNIIDQAKGE